MKLTTAEQNYILAIHRLSNGERVSTNQLAQEIGIAAASVTDMVQRLAEKEYVRYEKYKGVSLLPTGLKIAKKLSNTKSLWQEFLQHHLQLTNTETAGLLEQLQHVQSPHFAEQFKAYLAKEAAPVALSTELIQRPHQVSTTQADLFSAPPKSITKEPSTLQKIEEQTVKPREVSANQRTLTDCSVGQSIYIVGLQSTFREAKELLVFQQLPLGVKLTVKSIHQFDKSMVLSNGNREFLISQKLASLILIEE